MIKTFRRVVTGLNAQGRSVIVSDETMTDAYERPEWPGCGVTSAWSAGAVPVDNTTMPKAIAGFPVANGVSLMIMEIAPESELDAMSPEQRARALEPVARGFPQAIEIDTSKSPAMHATDTMDMLIMLQGELVAIVDDGEVTLKPFDVLIQRGVNHGWINRSDKPAIIAATVIDAKSFDRGDRAGTRTYKPHDQ